MRVRKTPIVDGKYAKGLKKAQDNNETYLLNLSSMFRFVGKRALAAGAAAALEAAIDNTVVDTGRAASNWRLSAGKPSGMAMGSLESWGGERFDTNTIKNIKSNYYGYRGSDRKPIDGGTLSSMLKIGKLGTPSLFLYNPIAYGVKNPDGAGRSYAENAFRLMGTPAQFVGANRQVVEVGQMAALQAAREAAKIVRAGGRIRA